MPYAAPEGLSMDLLRHADQVAIVKDTGALRQVVQERTRRAWEVHREADQAK